MGRQILGFEDDHIILTYEGGDNCSNGQPSKTVIRFDCAPEAMVSLHFKILCCCFGTNRIFTALGVVK